MNHILKQRLLASTFVRSVLYSIMTWEQLWLKGIFSRFRYWVIHSLQEASLGNRPTPLPKQWLNHPSLRFRNDFMLAVSHYLRTNQIYDREYWEFGSYGAHTIRMALNVFGPSVYGPPLCKKFTAFDSFRGMPEPEGIDQAKPWFQGACSHDLAEFRAVLARDLALDRLRIVEGFFEDSLSEYDWTADQVPGIVYVDCDYYASIKTVLEFLKDKLAHGTIIAFDDWDLYYGDPERGGRKAFSEFREQTQDRYVFCEWIKGLSGVQGFICLERTKVGTEVH